MNEFSIIRIHNDIHLSRVYANVWVIWMNVVYKFVRISVSSIFTYDIETDIQDSNEWLKFILRWKFHFAISFYWLPGKDSNRAFFPSVNYYSADWI